MLDPFVPAATPRWLAAPDDIALSHLVIDQDLPPDPELIRYEYPKDDVFVRQETREVHRVQYRSTTTGEEMVMYGPKEDVLPHLRRLEVAVLFAKFLRAVLCRHDLSAALASELQRTRLGP